MSRSCSSRLPWSTLMRMRCSVGITKWNPHCGQHHSTCLTRSVSTVAPQPSHFWNRPDGTDRLVALTSAGFFFCFVLDHQAAMSSAPEALFHLEKFQKLRQLAD